MSENILDTYTWTVKEWHTLATDYKEETLGNARIKHESYRRGFYGMWGIDGYLFFRVKENMPLTLLQARNGKKWHTWMVDDPPQWRSMQIFAEQARGTVLTTGLGLGLLAQELTKNPLVDQILVVERDPDIAALVGKYLPPRVAVVVDDFYSFLDKDETLWDTILLDLWVTHDKEEKERQYLTEVIPLIVKVRQMHPQASVSVHGFLTVSDIRVVSDEMMNFIAERRPYS